MHFIPLTRQNKNIWNDFCLHQSERAWFWHTTEWLDYLAREKTSAMTKDISLMVSDGNELIALVPLLVESKGCLTAAGRPIPAPIFSDALTYTERSDLRYHIFNYIHWLARHKYHSPLMKFSMHPLERSAIGPWYNDLTDLGFTDESYETRFIDLRQTEDELWTGMRDGHRYSIDKARKTCEARVFHKYNTTRKDIDRFIDMQLLDYPSPWMRQLRRSKLAVWHRWIKSNNAILVGLYDTTRNKYIGYETYVHYKGMANGAASATAKETHGLPVRHLVEWTAIQYFKDHGFLKYDIGGPMSATPTEKAKNVAYFKAGFGGYTAPIYVGVRRFKC